MIIAHRNKITEYFCKKILAKDEVIYIEKKMSEKDDIQLLKQYIMYYDKVVIGVSCPYDYFKLIDIYKLEDDDIRLILWFDDYSEYSKTCGLFTKKEIKYSKLCISTIEPSKLHQIFSKFMEEVYRKKYTDSEVVSICNYLKYKHNVNKELSALASIKTKKDLKEYLSKDYTITPNNFSYHLLMKTKTKPLATFLQEYKYNMNYIITILDNYIDKCMVLYGCIKQSQIAQMDLFTIIKDEKLLKDTSVKDINNMKRVLERYSYNTLYCIKEKIDQAVSRLDKQIIVMELL